MRRSRRRGRALLLMWSIWGALLQRLPVLIAFARVGDRELSREV